MLPEPRQQRLRAAQGTNNFFNDLTGCLAGHFRRRCSKPKAPNSLFKIVEAFPKLTGFWEMLKTVIVILRPNVYPPYGNSDAPGTVRTGFPGAAPVLALPAVSRLFFDKMLYFSGITTVIRGNLWLKAEK
jgi:hypothetical protein